VIKVVLKAKPSFQASAFTHIKQSSHDPRARSLGCPRSQWRSATRIDVYRPIYTVDDSLILQDDLSHIEEWAEKWMVIFNTDKCEELQVT